MTPLPFRTQLQPSKLQHSATSEPATTPATSLGTSRAWPAAHSSQQRRPTAWTVATSTATTTHGNANSDDKHGLNDGNANGEDDPARITTVTYSGGWAKAFFFLFLLLDTPFSGCSFFFVFLSIIPTSIIIYSFFLCIYIIELKLRFYQIFLFILFFNKNESCLIMQIQDSTSSSMKVIHQWNHS